MNTTPLRFRPLLQRTIWGGRRLGEQLGKPIGPESDYAESWEIVDHGSDQSVVADGSLAGQTLRDLVRERGKWLLGPAHLADAFPLLLKYLDCNRVLSVQVHPDDAYASRLSPPDLGKTEAWYIVAAEPGSVIYAGLKEGVDRTALTDAVSAGRTDDVLHCFHPQPGDCVFVPAGTVHALGAGLLVAEIQQSSDTTFRLFDWNRLDADGNPRPLHVAQALDVTDYSSGPVSPRRLQRSDHSPQTLVSCEKFILSAVRGAEMTVGGDASCHIVTVPHGEATVQPEGGESTRLRRGDTVLLPAASGPTRLRASENGVLLEIRLP